MRILFISRKWPPAIGGMETYSAELVRELAGLPGVTVDTMVLPGRDNGKPPHFLLLAVFLMKVAGALPFIVRRYDVIHFGDFVLSPLCLFAIGCRRKVVTVHGLDLLYGRRRGILPFFYRLMTKVMKGVFRVIPVTLIANSAATARLAAENGFAAAVVPLGTAIRSVPNATTQPAETILFTGRLVSRKGAAWFAEHVLPLLPHRFRLAVIGPQTDATETAKLQLNDRVDLLGFAGAEELDVARRQALCVVMPNRPARDGEDIEGFGLVAPETAMAGGVLLASAVDGIPSAVKDEKTGFLLPENDAEAWAHRILDIASWSAEERDAWTTRSVEVARSYYTWTRVAQETRDIYLQA